jgi:mannose-1-phosphate guanylyltransferase
MKKNHYVVIMAGGIGSRFWPVSRSGHPKQFHDMLGTGETLIQATYRRFAAYIPAENILVVTNVLYRDILHEQLPQLNEPQVLYEPVGRNTAPCIAYAAYKIQKRDPKAVILVSPADHLIKSEEGFRQDVELALDVAGKQPNLITIGISPTRPDTGYGYIQYHDDGNAQGLFKVKTFTEKPSLEIARTFLMSGDFVWNSGIFIFSVKSIIDAFEEHLSELSDLFKGIRKHLDTAQEAKHIADVYAKAKNISIDYGVMEKANNVYVIRSHFGWSDLGTWNSLYEEMHHDGKGNASTGDVVLLNALNNVVKEYTDKLVVVKGVDNLIIVNTPDVLLICPRDQEQSIRDIVAEIRQNKGEKFT